MSDNIIERILKCMAVAEIYPDVQKVQTEHRMKLVRSWGIKEGDKVFEIGCGQGDTTAVLAYYVGENGHVHGIDIASPSYGSPITVGDSAKYLLESELGPRISMSYEVDILSDSIDFAENEYDAIVFSDCSWYFKSQEELLKVFKKVRKYGKKLCFAESDIRIVNIEQYAHLQSALIQAQFEVYKKESSSNIRTLVTQNDVTKLMSKSEWNVTGKNLVYTEDLQDGVWEVEYVLNEVLSDIKRNDSLPLKMKDLLLSQCELLRYYKDLGYMKPLPSFVILAQ